MKLFYFEAMVPPLFIQACQSLADISPALVWPGFEIQPLQNEKASDTEYYAVFISVVNEHKFMERRPSALEMLPRYVIDDLNGKKCTLVLDYSNETGRLVLCEFIHRQLQDAGVNDFDNVFILAQNRLFNSKYLGVKVFAFDYFIASSAASLHQQIDCTWEDRLNMAWQTGKQKNILCLNATPRLHRWLTVASLKKDRLLDDSIVSFLGENGKPVGGFSLDKIVAIANSIGMGELEDSIRWLDQNTPLKVDSFTETGNALVNKIDLSVYEDSLISLVTETGLDNEHLRITEKSFQALAIGHPVVLISHPRSVRLAEELGFDVFRDTIDHAYDEVDDWVPRMNMAIKEANRFCENWRRGLVDVEKVQAVSRRNRDWLRNGFAEFYSKRYALPIWAELASRHKS